MNLKKTLTNKVQTSLLRKKFKVNSVFNFNFFEDILYQLIKKRETINFIQIGANDGKRFDPIHEFIKYNPNNIKGIVIEPVKDYYQQLVKTYANYSNIKPLNFAIHNKLKETKIYKVGKQFESKVPEFALGIASFDKDHHKKTNIPSNFIVTETVNCKQLKEIIAEHKIDHLDILLLDTEGYDYEILNNINFDEVNPSLIRFEHGLASGTMQKDQFEKLKQLLNNNDYQLVVDAADVTAIKTMLLYE
jgi:FkbM family methyltransferase